MFGHVGPDAGGDVEVDCAQDVDLDALALQDAGAEVDEALGVAALG